jgi:transitional endoplasmic reticulum ATPase
MKNEGYADPDIAMFLGLPEDPDADTRASIPRLLDGLQGSLEKSGAACLSARARGNFAKLAAALKLNPTEERVLEFFACLQVESPLVDTWRLVNKSREFEVSRYVARILGLPQSAVSTALSSGACLTKCGLLKNLDHPLMRDRLEFHSAALARQLLRDSYDPGELLKAFGVMTTPEPKLGLGDFPHLQASLDLLLPYLKKVRSARRPGVNFLLHGPPGTGKTQLVRVLGQALGIPVFELDTGDSDGDPRGPQCRLAALNLAQAYFQNTSSLLVFDEAEDVLTPSPRDRGAANSHKGWFNQMLEKNRQPMFWISNSIDSLDPAFARRFDFILELPIPPKAQRDRILRKEIGKLVTPGLIDHLAGIEHLAPAVITRARDVIQVISRDIPKGNRDAAFTRVIGGILKAQGHADPAKATIQVIQPGLYDIAHLNTPADLPQIAANLRRNPSARLCLYGPPGTGKTSFGHWLAQEIGQPLQLQKASDLLSPFLGLTEQKIARAFETAKQDGAVLLIDEVDSFLRDRTQTRHSWEVTQINEMLTQIESFPGILIASTNLIDQLDPASMRRFDIKLHFGYLLPDQASRLLVSYCQNLKLQPPTSADLDLAQSLETATPGDFAAVARQHRFQPFRDAGGLLQAVSAESALKAGPSRRIGFQ